MMSSPFAPENETRLYLTFVLVTAHSLPVFIHQVLVTIIRRLPSFDKYSIQPIERTPFDRDVGLWRKVWVDTFINHCVKIPVLVYLTLPLIEGALKDCSIELAFTLPSLQTLLLHLTISVIVEDFLFYWSHRLLHTPLFYPIHSKHHEFHTLSAYPIASEYTHPIESLLGNIIPTSAGPAVCGISFSTMLVWIVVRMWKTCDAHCGYSLPFPVSPFNLGYPLNAAKRHDYHHEVGSGSFGSFFGFWDYVCGTDKGFLMKEERERKVAGKGNGSKEVKAD